LSAVATCAVTIGLTFYAIKTKSDFTNLESAFRGKIKNNLGGICAFIWLIFCVSLMNVFWIRSSVLNCMIAIVVGLIYCVYLIIDTQSILGGGKRQISLDNYAMGAAVIYMDIIGLFLKIL
jgi:FtsH-binding integral membrane protein